MKNKIRAFIALSLLSISFSSFAIVVTCPDVKDYLNVNGRADLETLTDAPSIGQMTIRQGNPRVTPLIFFEWREVTTRFGYVYCSYRTNNPNGVIVVTVSGGWLPFVPMPGQPNPWIDNTRQGICNIESGGTRETCQFSRFG